jgi:hypothetical protein
LEDLSDVAGAADLTDVRLPSRDFH